MPGFGYGIESELSGVFWYSKISRNPDMVVPCTLTTLVKTSLPSFRTLRDAP